MSLLQRSSSKAENFCWLKSRPVAEYLFNQPAGHLEPAESIIQGAIRETLEETGYTFIPQWVLGIYRWHSHADNITFLRFAFAGST